MGNAADSTPPLITKKWLCFHYRLVHPCGRPYYPGLRRMVLTAEVLERAGLDPAQVFHKSKTTFTATESLALIQILNL